MHNIKEWFRIGEEAVAKYRKVAKSYEKSRKVSNNREKSKKVLKNRERCEKSRQVVTDKM